MNVAHAAAAALLVLATATAHAASPFDGYWMKVNADKSLDPGSQFEFRVDRNQIAMNTPQGAAYKARLDGADAPMANDPYTTSVSVKAEGRNVIVETLKNNGKPWQVTTFEVQADGKTAKASWKNLKTGDGGSYVLSKQ